MNARRTLLVGSGKIGSGLGHRLLAAGGEVVALRRSADGIDPGFAPVVADLSRPLADPLPRVTAMVVTLPPGDDPDFYPVALQHLAAALPALPERTVFVSSTRVFEGWDAARPLDETDEPRTVSDRGQALVDGERAAVDLFGAVVVRPAGIYGPGRERLIRQVLAGTPVDHDRHTNRIHASDLVAALDALLAIDDDAAVPAVLHAVDRRPATLGEVVTFIADRLGAAVPPRGEPDERRGTVLDGSRLVALLGELEYPTFVEGYGRMIADRA